MSSARYRSYQMPIDGKTYSWKYVRGAIGDMLHIKIADRYITTTLHIKCVNTGWRSLISGNVWLYQSDGQEAPYIVSRDPGQSYIVRMPDGSREVEYMIPEQVFLNFVEVMDL